jgi:hypothetical protein
MSTVKIAAHYVQSGTAVGAKSEFAQALDRIVRERRPRKVIETGTFLGQGTTAVIAAALRDAGIDDARFYSIECNQVHHEHALRNLRDAGLAERVTLLHGLSVPRSLLPTLQQIEERCVRNIEFDEIFIDHEEHQRAWLYFKETDFGGVPEDLLGECLRRFDGRPDLVLLDSGGHMGNLEFNYLVERLDGPCVVALDDIHHIKHHKSFRQLQSDDRFELVTSSREKFGFCVALFKGPKTRAASVPPREARGGTAQTTGAATSGDFAALSGALTAEYDRAQALAASGRPAEALQALQQLSTLEGVLSLVWNDIGALHFFAGDRDAAQRAFEHATLLDPRQLQALKNLADLHQQAGRPEEARRALQTAARIAPDDADVAAQLRQLG